MDLHHCSHQQNFVTTSGGRFDRTRRSHEEREGFLVPMAVMGAVKKFPQLAMSLSWIGKSQFKRSTFLCMVCKVM